MVVYVVSQWFNHEGEHVDSIWLNEERANTRKNEIQKQIEHDYGVGNTYSGVEVIEWQTED